MVEVLLEDVGSGGAYVEPEQLAESTALPSRQVAGTLEQAPASVLERDAVALPAQVGCVLTARLVNRLVEMGHDVELVEDVERLAGMATDHLEIGLPHVAADDMKRLGPRLAEPGEEAVERLDRAGLSDPEQAAAAGVNLVHEGEVLVPLSTRKPPHQDIIANPCGTMPSLEDSDHFNVISNPASGQWPYSSPGAGEKSSNAESMSH